MKKLYKFTSVLLASILALSTISVSAIEDDTVTSDEMIPISSAEELSSINNSSEALAGNYYLTCDIDLAQSDQLPNDPDNNFIAIGSEEAPFTGTFDGKNYEVMNLQIFTSQNNQGLFGVVNGTISNLQISGSVAGGIKVGSIAGYTTGTINGCKSNVSVSGAEKVGGLVGEVARNGKVSVSDNHGSVSGTGSCIGGLAGYVSDDINGAATISKSYNYGNVSSEGEKVGGLVGHLGCGEVKDCNNYGKVSGSNMVGGLVGYMKGSDTTQVDTNGYKKDLKPTKLINCIYYIAIDDRDNMNRLVGKIDFMGGFFGGTVSYIENCTFALYDPYELIWLSVFN